MREMFHGPLAMATHALATAPFWLAVAGVVVAFLLYIVFPSIPGAIQRAARPIYNLLDNKYYMDWFNDNVIVRGARGLGFGLWKGGDEALIDGTVVNGSWKVVGWISGVVRWFQTGYVYHYALVMIMGVFFLMTYFVWFNR